MIDLFCECLENTGIKNSEGTFHNWKRMLTFQPPTPKNGQTNSKNLKIFAAELFECV